MLRLLATSASRSAMHIQGDASPLPRGEYAHGFLPPCTPLVHI